MSAQPHRRLRHGRLCLFFVAALSLAAWDGREWQWQSGHYDIDARYNNYYDDGSWE